MGAGRVRSWQNPSKRSMEPRAPTAKDEVGAFFRYRLPPGQKCSPAPCRTTLLIELRSCDASHSIAISISLAISIVSALKYEGSFSSSNDTCPATRSRMAEPVLRGRLDFCSARSASDSQMGVFLACFSIRAPVKPSMPSRCDASGICVRSTTPRVGIRELERHLANSSSETAPMALSCSAVKEVAPIPAPLTAGICILEPRTPWRRREDASASRYALAPA